MILRVYELAVDGASSTQYIIAPSIASAAGQVEARGYTLLRIKEAGSMFESEDYNSSVLRAGKEHKAQQERELAEADAQAQKAQQAIDGNYGKLVVTHAQWSRHQAALIPLVFTRTISSFSNTINLTFETAENYKKARVVLASLDKTSNDVVDSNSAPTAEKDKT